MATADPDVALVLEYLDQVTARQVDAADALADLWTQLRYIE